MQIPIDSQNIHSIFSSLTIVQVTIIASAIGAVVAALVAALFSLLNTWIVKRSENERALRELIIKAALETQKQHKEMSDSLKSKTLLLPLDAYIVHITVVLSVLLQNRITQNNVTALLDEIDAIVDKSNRHIEQTRIMKKGSS